MFKQNLVPLIQAYSGSLLDFLSYLRGQVPDLNIDNPLGDPDPLEDR